MQEPLSQQRLGNSTVAIFGGGNGWGRKITDTATEMARKVIVVEKEATAKEQRSATGSSDIIFIATPDVEINTVLLKIQDRIKGRILLDCATNKSSFAATLQKIAQTTSVCSTHPMVRSETSARGQNAIIMPVGSQPGHAMSVARSLYEKLEMDIHEFDFEKHSELMVILQLIPHLMQRLLIQTLSHGLEQQGMKLADISKFAPANFVMTELAMGRVATQRPDVSAGIIIEGLKSPTGKSVLAALQQSIASIHQASDSRDDLAQFLAEDTTKLDPDIAWRNLMTEKTNVILERAGNLKKRSFQIIAPNTPGILLKITLLLHEGFHMDMNALDSHVKTDVNGKEIVCFDVGLSDRSNLDEDALCEKLAGLDSQLIIPKSFE